MWGSVKLIDVCERITQGPNPKYKGRLNENLRVLKTKHLYDNVIHYDEADYLSDESFKSCSKAELQDGDVLLAIVGQGSINKCNVFEKPDSGRFIFTRALGLLRTNKAKLDPYFLKLFLQSAQGKGFVDSGIGGTSGQQVVTTTHLKNIKMPLPPLNEQKSIVAILDQAFADINHARQLAERNLKNSREIFDSTLNQIFTEHQKGWDAKLLGDISQINYGYTASSKHGKVGPHFLRITDIQNNNVDWSKVPYCDFDLEKDMEKFLLKTGDIVFARTGATTGKSYLLDSPPKSVFASYLIRVRLLENSIKPEFLNMFFQTSTYWQAINSGLSGSAQGGFNASKLAGLLIPHPTDKSAQDFIVNKLKNLTDETIVLEEIYQQKITALDELKQSLLQKAFRGELTQAKSAA